MLSFFFSLSIFYFGYQLGTYNSESKGVVTSIANQTFKSTDKGLMTVEETAEYLSLSAEQLEGIVNKQAIERSKLSSFDNYSFIPYITIKNERFFNKDQVDEWIKHSPWQEVY